MKIIKYFIVCLALGCADVTQGQVPDSVKLYAKQKVNAFAKDYPGLSVAVSHRGKIVWQTQVGYANLEKKTPVTANTKFNIYSTSKMITGLAFLKLLHTGKLKSLDVKLGTIDPQLPKKFHNITIKHLLTHTSGIGHYQGRKDWIKFAALRVNTPAEAVAYFANRKLQTSPGRKYKYTTYGMVLASHILEKITGKKYEEALNHLLRFSSPITLDSPTAAKATPYRKKRKQWQVLPNINAASKYGGGGLIASAAQLMEAGQLLYSNSFMPPNKLKNYFRTSFPQGKNNGVAFGTGAGIVPKFKNYKGEILYTLMGGGSPGGRSYLAVLVDLKVAVAITANFEGDGEKAYKMAFGLAKKFAGLE